MFSFKAKAGDADENNDQQQQQQPQAQQLDPNSSGAQQLTPEEMRLKRLAMLNRFSPAAAKPSSSPSSSSASPTTQQQATSSSSQHSPAPSTTIKRQSEPMDIDSTPPSKKSTTATTTTTPVSVSDEQKLKLAQQKFEHDLLTNTLNLSSTTSSLSIPQHLLSPHQKFSIEQHAELLLFEKLKSIRSCSDAIQLINRAMIASSEELSREKSRGEAKSRPDKIQCLQQYIDLLLNYLVLCLSETDCFIMSPMTATQLLAMLLQDQESTSGGLSGIGGSGGALQSPIQLDERVLSHVIQQIESNERLKIVFENVLEELSNQFSKLSFLDRYYPYLACLLRLTKYKEVAQLMVNHPKWLSVVKNGSSMENQSLLGPFFRLSAYYDHPKVGEQFFGGGQLNGMTQQDLEFKRTTIRSEVRMYQDFLHKIFMNFVRPKETRAQAMQWLYSVLEGNKSRLKMHEDVYASSSESFLTNFCSLMLRLCEPFVSSDKFKTVDGDYPMVNSFVSFSDDTHIIATEPEAKELYKDEFNKGREFSFITECFFLCYRALKIGALKTLEKYQHVLQRYNDLRREMRRITRDDPNYAQGEQEMQRMLIMIVAAEVHILDPDYHKKQLQFYKFASQFLLFSASPNKDGKLIVDPGQADQIPRAYKCLSEFMVMDMIEMCKFLSQRSVESLASGDELDFILTMLITFTHYDHYLKNHVRAKVPELYCTFVPKELHRTRDTDLPMSLQNFLMHHKPSQEHLMPAFIDLYIDMEHTGSSHQFYEKFTPRFYISLLFKFLWQFKTYRDAFVVETNKNTQFVKFFNLMLNDATYLLDESLKLLNNIRNYEMEYDEATGVGTRPNDQQMSVRRRDEQQLRGYMELARETVHMMSYLSRDVPKPFLRPEMRDRVASMLNYFLVELAGPQCQNLKVKNPEKYNFNPKELLSEIVDTYVHFSKFEEFVTAVATDSRSFKPEVFHKVIAILKKIGTRTPTVIHKFEEFATAATNAAQQILDEEEDMGDVPDEFLDPITFMFMSDPVLLPASKIVIDRSTIERHLLNDQTDPFNRSHLTHDMLEEATEMKQKIKEWKESQKK